MPLDRAPTQLFGVPAGYLGQLLQSFVSLATCPARFRSVLALSLSVILVFEGCSIAARGSGRVPTAELKLIPVSRVEETVAVGANPYMEPGRQKARFGGNPRRFSVAGVVPVRVWVHNLRDLELVVRSAEIMLELPDGSRRVALSASAVADRLRRAEKAMARELSPGEAPSEVEILEEESGRGEHNRPVPDEPRPAKFTFEAPVTVWMWQVAGEAISKETDPRKAFEGLVALLSLLPVTLAVDLAWSMAKSGYVGAKTRSANKARLENKARLDRDRRLERLEDVKLGRSESASAALYFRVAPSEVPVVSDAVLTVRFSHVEGDEDVIVRLPLSPPEFNRTPAEEKARDFT